jgi:hypothetical protein
MYSPRWPIAMLLGLGGLVLWIVSMIAYPFTSWGVDVEQLRPSVAAFSRDCALGSLVFFGLAAFCLFWHRDNSLTRLDKGIGAAIALFASTMMLRLVWLAWVVWSG